MKQLSIAVFSLMLSLSAAAAPPDLALDIRNGRPLLVIIQNATARGMAIDTVVSELIKAFPERAADVVTATFVLMPAMPPGACHVADPEAVEEWEWRPQCERLVIQAAVAAGIDPTVVTAATAAGRLAIEPPAAAEFGLDKARRHTPVQVPNGGAGGGGIPSPS